MADSNFPPIPDPTPPARDRPEFDTSRMCIGNMLAQGKSARLYDVTIPDKDNKGMDTEDKDTKDKDAGDKDAEDKDTYKPYVLKMFHEEEAFIRERAAYERMEKIPALEGFVPRYYGTPQIPHSNIMQPIILSKHNGMKLESVISIQSLQALLNSKKLLTHIIQTLHEAGVYHGKLTSKNILVSNEQGHEMTVFNFCHAALKKDLERLEAQDMEDMDVCCMEEIFDKFIWAKAHEAATDLLQSVRNGHRVGNPQDYLAKLLDMIESPDQELVRSIMDVYTVPDPVLALPLAGYLAHDNQQPEAIEMLKQSADSFIRLSPPPGQKSTDMLKVLQMKMAVARYTAQLRAGSMDENMTSTKSHYEEAVRFYLCSMPEASPADKTAMTLRHELAKYYYHFKLYSDAMDLCIQAMADAIEVGSEVSLDVWRDYGELIEETKKRLSHLINDIKDDKLKGNERSWRPWANLPTYEEAYRRAVEAKGLCNEPWASHRMTKLAVKFQVIPCAGLGMMQGLRRDSVMEDYL